MIAVVSRPLAAALLVALAGAVSLTAGCSRPPIEPLKLEGNTLTVDNRSSQEWQHVEIWLNTYYRITTSSIPPNGRFQATLDTFVAGYGQRFEFRHMQVNDLRLVAKLPDGKPLEIKKAFVVGGLAALRGRS
jgi:hypothetical protein